MGEFAGVAGILWEHLDVDLKRHVGILLNGNRREEAGASNNTYEKGVLE
jgi:hypothetical protein